jgi:hypothetical protein
MKFCGAVVAQVDLAVFLVVGQSICDHASTICCSRVCCQGVEDR